MRPENGALIAGEDKEQGETGHYFRPAPVKGSLKGGDEEAEADGAASCADYVQQETCGQYPVSVEWS